MHGALKHWLEDDLSLTHTKQTQISPLGSDLFVVVTAELACPGNLEFNLAGIQGQQNELTWAQPGEGLQTFNI